MKLRNRQDGLYYEVSTEDDDCGGFVIYASCCEVDPAPKKVGGKNFVMHYRKLADLTDEWEDV